MKIMSMSWLWRNSCASMEVGDWVVLYDLGCSKCCRVVRVKHKQTGQDAALKVFDLRKMVTCDPRIQSVEEARGCVRQEVDCMSKLQAHPNIIQAYSVSHCNKYSYLIMELVHGGELYDFVRSRGKLSESRARLFLRQLLSALEYCHGHFIVHRDLKLENVLLLENGQHIKLIDFGMSCRVKPGQLLHRRCGSPDYVAPEILSGQGYTGMPADLWSLGVMLYTMLHGFLPYTLQQQKQNMTGTRKCHIDITIHQDDLSLECQDLLYSLLTPDPRDRLTLPLARHHSWILTGYEKPPDCCLPKYAPTCKIDPDLISKLCYFDFDPVQLFHDVSQGTHCQAVAMYYGLAPKSIRSCYSLPELTR